MPISKLKDNFWNVFYELIDRKLYLSNTIVQQHPVDLPKFLATGYFGH